MDYLLENLGPERFQEVCNALLAKAFPKTQCFPVGQRDGGRDAVSFFHEKQSDGFIVYQVKFSRKPLAEKDPHGWLKEIVKNEAPKVRDLIPKGAEEYYLLTNVPGTANPQTGSIDIVQELLNEHFDIPAQCWWRDDLNRRLDDGWNIKWSYPEILSGPDILRCIIENGLGEDAKRRTSAIATFIRDQFDRDTEVRFKQVELQNKLLDLFIDVPINLQEAASSRNIRPLESRALRTIKQQQTRSSRGSREEVIGAATLLLDPLAQSYINRVVIKGAPGQGKSTIVQYICQIHRQRLLQAELNDKRIPDSHRYHPVRLPLKVDCRDLSLWLDRKDPFSAEDAASVPADWQKTLESFLSALITHYSGGVAFAVSDLHAVMRLSALLLVFDGLDEVADIRSRREVVDQISKGVNRLTEIAVSVQTIVTSRPAAFANSPGLPEHTFIHLSLSSINRPLIEEYAEKWLRARKLEGKGASDVRRTLKDKLDQPHLRELARNPMQLAILLSLIQTRGGSLPDKRTALYDSYVDLFFNREAEKSTVVRDHRDLLVDIHRYLAWKLQAESQTSRNRGSVSADRLRQLVEDYLKNEGHDSSLARQLFTGMVERVVALVSRVEGTYEFEVQPLREYFAARHLYNTAPCSPPGHPQNGTLPERFDALCRDFYWLNVTRFYAGCYSKGELPSLVDRLEELAKDSLYSSTSHPQSLAATLLADWVFAQHPKSMKPVVALVLDGIGLMHIVASQRSVRRNEILVLPRQSGNEELLDKCFELLMTGVNSDYAWRLLDLIRANATRDVSTQRWLTACESVSGKERTCWIRHGRFLGVLSNVPVDQLNCLLDDEEENSERLMSLLHGGQRKFVEGNETRVKVVVDYLLSRTLDFRFQPAQSVLDMFFQTLQPQRYAIAFQSRLPTPLKVLWERTYPLSMRSSFELDEHISTDSLISSCKQIVDLGQILSERPAVDWATELGCWSELIEGARQLFGDRWAFFVFANTSAGIRSKQDPCDDASELHDRGIPLCRRSRYARLRAGSSIWWKSQLEAATNQEDVAFTLLILLTWAGPTVVTKHARFIDERLCQLDSDTWLKLSEALLAMSYCLGPERRGMEIPSHFSNNHSERMIVAMAARVGDRASRNLFRGHLRDYDGDDPVVLEFCQRAALDAGMRSPGTWQKWLPVIARSYAKGVISDPYYGRRFARVVAMHGMPHEIAEKIMRSCQTFPAELVAMAEQTCRQRVAEMVTPVGTVAEKENWFGLLS